MKLFAQGETEQATRDIQKLLADFDREQQALLKEGADFTRLPGRATTAAMFFGSLFTFCALVWACVLILRDIAARRRAEEALAVEHNLLRSIIDTMPDHVFVKDTSGRYMLDNESHRRLLAHKGDAEPEGHTVFDYFPPEDAARYDDDDRFVIETGERDPQPRGRRGRRRQAAKCGCKPRRCRCAIAGADHRPGRASPRTSPSGRAARRSCGALPRSSSRAMRSCRISPPWLRTICRSRCEKSRPSATGCGRSAARYSARRGWTISTRMEDAAQRMQVLIQDLLKLSRVTSRAQPFETCELGEIVLAVVSDLEVAIEQKSARVEVGALPRS